MKRIFNLPGTQLIQTAGFHPYGAPLLTGVKAGIEF